MKICEEHHKQTHSNKQFSGCQLHDAYNSRALCLCLRCAIQFEHALHGWMDSLIHAFPARSPCTKPQDGLSPAFYLSNRFLLLDPPGDGPSGGSLLKAIDHILEQLTPERARYRVFAKDVAPEQSEKWYGVPYRQTEIPKSVLQGWRLLDLFIAGHL